MLHCETVFEQYELELGVLLAHLLNGIELALRPPAVPEAQQ
jgi:hypothetical protein